MLFSLTSHKKPILLSTYIKEVNPYSQRMPSTTWNAGFSLGGGGVVEVIRTPITGAGPVPQLRGYKQTDVQLIDHSATIPKGQRQLHNDTAMMYLGPARIPQLNVLSQPAPSTPPLRNISPTRGRHHGSGASSVVNTSTRSRSGLVSHNGVVVLSHYQCGNTTHQLPASSSSVRRVKYPPPSPPPPLKASPTYLSDKNNQLPTKSTCCHSGGQSRAIMSELAFLSDSHSVNPVRRVDSPKGFNKIPTTEINNSPTRKLQMTDIGRVTEPAWRRPATVCNTQHYNREKSLPLSDFNHHQLTANPNWEGVAKELQGEVGSLKMQFNNLVETVEGVKHREIVLENEIVNLRSKLNSSQMAEVSVPIPQAYPSFPYSFHSQNSSSRGVSPVREFASTAANVPPQRLSPPLGDVLPMDVSIWSQNKKVPSSPPAPDRPAPSHRVFVAMSCPSEPSESRIATNAAITRKQSDGSARRQSEESSYHSNESSDKPQNEELAALTSQINISTATGSGRPPVPPSSSTSSRRSPPPPLQQQQQQQQQQPVNPQRVSGPTYPTEESDERHSVSSSRHPPQRQPSVVSISSVQSRPQLQPQPQIQSQPLPQSQPQLQPVLRPQPQLTMESRRHSNSPSEPQNPSSRESSHPSVHRQHSSGSSAVSVHNLQSFDKETGAHHPLNPPSSRSQHPSIHRQHSSSGSHPAVSVGAHNSQSSNGDDLRSRNSSNQIHPPLRSSSVAEIVRKQSSSVGKPSAGSYHQSDHRSGVEVSDSSLRPVPDWKPSSPEWNSPSGTMAPSPGAYDDDDEPEIAAVISISASPEREQSPEAPILQTISIEDLDGNALHLSVQECLTVLELKSMISQKWGYETSAQKLVFKAAALNDNSTTLYDLGTREGSIIHLLVDSPTRLSIPSIASVPAIDQRSCSSGSSRRTHCAVPFIPSRSSTPVNWGTGSGINQSWQITVQDLAGNMFTLPVSSTATVFDLKMKIQVCFCFFFFFFFFFKTHILSNLIKKQIFSQDTWKSQKTSEQRLVFRGRELSDSKRYVAALFFLFFF